MHEDAAPIGSSFRERLLAIREALHGGTQVERDLVDTGLDALCEVVVGLPERTTEQLAPAIESLLPVLARILRTARQRGELDSGAWRDLRTVVRRLITSVAILESTDEAQRARERLTVIYQRVDFPALVAALLEPFAALARQRGVSVIAELPPAFEAELDASKVGRTLVNLFFNAVRYAPRGGEMRCTLRTESYDEYIILDVFDSGQQVAPGSAERIFERGRQMERNIFALADGEQWGLAVSRDYVELHGGSLQLRRPAQPGCTFRVRMSRRAPRPLEVPMLPRAHWDALVELAGEVAAYAASELRAEDRLGAEAQAVEGRPLVLIVDDSRAVQRVLERALGDDYTIAAAFNGAEGLREARRLLPSLIVADLHMPELDGEVMIRSVRAYEELADTPILVLTGMDDRERAARLLSHGVQDLMSKPFSVTEVRARVDNLVQGRKTREVLNETIGRHESNLLTLALQVAEKHEELQAALEDVRAAREVAESSSHVKSNFLRMMSHELKTPIAAMQLQMFMLRQHLGGDLSEAVEGTLEGLTRSADRLLNLVDTSLEWARVESGRCQVTPEPVDLLGLVAEVAEQAQRFAKRRKVRLTVTSSAPPQHPPWVRNDPRILRLVVSNLLNYAVQATRTGAVEVTVGSDLHGSGEIAVVDGAPPIPPEHRHAVFSPFGSEVDLRWSAGAGSGLGLYVIRSIARAVGGDVDLRDSQEAGNTFAFNVPSVGAEHASLPLAAQP